MGTEKGRILSHPPNDQEVIQYKNLTMILRTNEYRTLFNNFIFVFDQS